MILLAKRLYTLPPNQFVINHYQNYIQPYPILVSNSHNELIGCIAGWACMCAGYTHLINGVLDDDNRLLDFITNYSYMFHEAKEWLELDETPAYNLFFPHFAKKAHLPKYKIGPKTASACVRIVAKGTEPGSAWHSLFCHYGTYITQ